MRATVTVSGRRAGVSGTRRKCLPVMTIEHGILKRRKG